VVVGKAGRNQLRPVVVGKAGRNQLRPVVVGKAGRNQLRPYGGDHCRSILVKYIITPAFGDNPTMVLW